MSYNVYYMTLCIAALYDDGKGVAINADKLTQVQIKNEHNEDVILTRVERDDTDKIRMLTNDIALIAAGDGGWSDLLVEDIKRSIHPSQKFSNVLKTAVAIYHKHVEAKAVEQVLMPLGFSSLKDYLRHTTNYPPQTIEVINKQLDDFRFPTDIAIAGKGEDGYEVHNIDWPGISQIARYGFTAVGKGQLLALPMLSEKYYRTMSKAEVVKILTEAKIAAEADEEIVGKRTDWVFLPKG